MSKFEKCLVGENTNKERKIKITIMENADFFFVEKNPLDTVLDCEMKNVRKLIQEKFNIKSVYLGYNKLTKELFSYDSNDPWAMLTGYPSIGKTSTMGFDLEELKSLVQSRNNVYLCYYAIPIDDMDLLIENSDYEDWDVEEYLSDLHKSNLVSIGSISFDGHKRCRTIKLILSPN